MFVHRLKRLKPFALLVSLLVLSILYTMNFLFIVKWRNEDNINILRPKLDQNKGHVADLNKHLSLLGEDFENSLDQYEVERLKLRKKLQLVQKISLHNSVSHGESLAPNVVWGEDLFVLIQVHSSPRNFMSRQAIRLSWGSMEYFNGDRQKNTGLR